LLVQNKVPKQKDTPFRLSPVLLTVMGVNQTRPSGLQTSQATAELKQVIAETTHEASAARRGSRGFANQKQNFKPVIPARPKGLPRTIYELKLVIHT